MDNLINEFVELKVEKELNAFSVKFLKYVKLQDFKKIVEHEFELIEQYKLKKAIIDLRLLPVYDTGMPEYIKEVWFPKVIELGLKYVAFVQPEKILGQMTMKKAHKEEEVKIPITMEHFGDFDEALNWLKSC